MDTTHTTRKRNRGNNNYSTDGDNKKVVKKNEIQNYGEVQASKV